MMRTFAFQRDRRPFLGDEGIPTIDELVEISVIIDLLKTIDKQYVQDKGVYSTEVMLLFGQLLTEARKVIE